METVVQRDRKVQIIFDHPDHRILKKHAWTIPIEKVGNEFITGQDLDHDKKIGKQPLTDKEKERYPFVINPIEGRYKARDRNWFDLRLDEDWALYNLIIHSKRIAPHVGEFHKNRAKYLGYFHDPETEAVANLDDYDKRFEAEKFIRGLSIDRYVPTILLINYKIGSTDFSISTKGVSSDRQKEQLILAAHRYPERILECDPKNNKSAAIDMFLLELIEEDVLIRKHNGDITFGGEYLGSNLEEVKKALVHEDNKHLAERLNIMLEEKKKGISSAVASEAFKKVADSDSAYLEKYNNVVNAFKAAIYEKEQGVAIKQLKVIEKMFPETVSRKLNIDFTTQKAQNMYEDAFSEEKTSKEDRFKAELDELSLEDLQKKISHHMTAFKEEDCKDFWNDKQKLIDYMINVKFEK